MATVVDPRQRAAASPSLYWSRRISCDHHDMSPVSTVAMPVSGLFSDLYQFTMLDAYQVLGMEETTVFSLFVRRLPANRNFLTACEMDTLLDDIEAFCFRDEDIDYVASLENFDPNSCHG